VLTIIIRIAMLPLTLKQLHSTKAIQSIQPRMLEIQKKYAKDRAKLAQEQMKLYKESGISPTGCAVPMLVQMPIWIALYQAIILSLAVTPEGLLNLSRYLYAWPVLYPLLPLNSSFLWLDLTKGDLTLAILVGLTMWLQQKMVTVDSPDSRVQSQNRMMLWMMPLMFAFFSLSFPSGLALYWVVSNIISIVIQYYVTGWGGLAGLISRKPAPKEDKFRRRIALESAPPKSAETPPAKSADTPANSTEAPPAKSQDYGGRKVTATGADIVESADGEISGRESVSKRLRSLFGYSDRYRAPKHRK
jgi:YidC/Oxa1 family membrane protein insertase